MRSISLAILTRAAQPIYDGPGVPGDSAFRDVTFARRRQFHALTARLRRGEIDAVKWGELMLASLQDGHVTGAYYGRLLAIQRVTDPTDVDLFRGSRAADAEFDFLNGFLEALEARDPRYWDEEIGEWLDDEIRRRQDMYLGKMRGTANQAFLEESGDDAFFDWRLGGSEDNCSDCPEYAAMGALGRDEWPTVPGAGDTPCLYNCNCSLVRTDDVAGFAPVVLT